ncbi:MAG: alpha/beta hydrolase [Leptospira sp.]|nr:alpha/beta hydrolase [Leptospira sp.]
MENNSTIVRPYRRGKIHGINQKLEFAKKHPEFIGYVTSSIFLSTQKQELSRKEIQILSIAEEDIFHFENQNIQYYHWKGNGQKILLVHGWNGNTGNFFKIIPELVAKGYDVFGIDLPGHGNSNGRYSNIVISAKSIRQLVSIVGNPEIIISHSFGGAVSTVAQELGVTAEKLVYIAPPLKLEILRENFCKEFNLSSIEGDYMRSIIERKVKRPLSSIDLEYAGKKFNNQLLVIHDKNDIEIPIDLGRAVAKAWKKSELFETEGLGHRLILRSQLVVGKILEFLS